MSCDCENKKRRKDYDKQYALAKKYAALERCIVVMTKRKDGSYAFCRLGEVVTGEIISYIHYL